MANGLGLRYARFSAINRGHKRGTAIGLGNRCSVLLSYGAAAVFLGFRELRVNDVAQNAQRRI